MKSRVRQRTRGITVRLARSRDVADLFPLFRGYLRFYRVRHTGPTARRFLRDRLRNREAVIFLGEEDGCAVGFVTMYPSYCSLAQRPIWILYDLFVDSRHRRSQVGRTLMDTARRFAESTGAQRIELSTALTNRPAQKLYEALGYRRDRRFLHYALTFSRA